MAKVLLVQSHYDRREGKERSDQPIPLGLIYIGTAIEDKHDVKIYDRNLNFKDSDFFNFLESFNPEIIGFGITTSEVIFDFMYLGKLIKEKYPKKLIVVGGVHATIEPDSVLKKPYVDFIIRGEGEEAFLEFCDMFDKDPKKLKTLKNVNNNPLRPLSNIENLKLPDYGLVDINKYAAFYLSLSRGCPGNCTFCYSRKMWGKDNHPFIRAYSKEKAIQAVKELVEKYKIRVFSIVDDNFVPFKSRAIEICKILENYDAHFFCFGRADYVNDEVLSALKKAGCHTMQIGFESGSQRILDLLNKKITVEQNYKAVECCKRNNITCDASFMIGLPTETEEDLEKTAEFIKKSRPDIVNLKIFLPLPGAELFDYCVNKSLIKKPTTLEEWADWTGVMIEVHHNVSQIPDKDLLKATKELRKVGYYKNRINRLIYWIKIREYGVIFRGVKKSIRNMPIINPRSHTSSPS
ncbi:MAG: radical SAM protein [Nanoarchaeota archaeon]|nr:radical SAM protein [Nanoarchaeota archaeon]